MKEKLTPQHLFGYIVAYMFWIIVLLIAFLFALISQSALELAAAKYYINDKFMHQMMIRFLDKTYLFILGLVWIILMVVVEEYFRTGVKKGVLIQRFALVFGIEMILIFVFDFSLWGLQNWVLSTDRIFLLVSELLLGAGLLVYRSYTKKKKLTRRS
jgi:hypothetical protein